jgi:sugar/nucleoside kinase (ribokinase family)
MRTDLGAAALMAPEDVSNADFQGCRHLHVEGYLLFNRDLIIEVLSCAKQSGCTISLDLGSFEVVGAAMDVLPGLLEQYVDMVFSNEDEGRAFCGDGDPEASLEALSGYCDIAAVKIGARGSLLRRGDETCRAEPVRAERVLDTTGAGDFWAAGFLYGMLTGRSLAESGRFGSVMGAEVVGYIGAELSEESWKRVIAELK